MPRTAENRQGVGRKTLTKPVMTELGKITANSLTTKNNLNGAFAPTVTGPCCHQSEHNCPPQAKAPAIKEVVTTKEGKRIILGEFPVEVTGLNLKVNSRTSAPRNQVGRSDSDGTCGSTTCHCNSYQSGNAC